MKSAIRFMDSSSLLLGKYIIEEKQKNIYLFVKGKEETCKHRWSKGMGRGTVQELQVFTLRN